MFSLGWAGIAPSLAAVDVTVEVACMLQLSYLTLKPTFAVVCVYVCVTYLLYGIMPDMLYCTHDIIPSYDKCNVEPVHRAGHVPEIMHA